MLIKNKTLFLLSLLMLFSCHQAFAATYYAIAGGGNWSSANTWAASTGQTVGGAGVPGAADTVNIDGTLTGTVTVDTITDLAGSLNCTGATHTLTFTSGKILTVSGNVTFGASMTVTGTGTLTINAASTITSNGITFPGKVTFNVNGTVTLLGNMVVTGVVTNSAATLTLNETTNETLTANGGLTASQAIAGTATIILGGGTWSGAGYVQTNLTFNSAGTITISGSVYYETGTMTYTAGTVTTTGSILDIGSSFTIPTGITWHSLTTVGSLTLTLPSDLTLTGNFIIGTGSSTVTTSGAYNINVGGNFSNNGFITGPATIVLDGTGTWSGASGAYVETNLTFNTAGTITVSSSVYYETGTMTYVAGTVTTTGSTLDIGSSMTVPTAITWNNIFTNTILTLTIGGDLHMTGSLEVLGDGNNIVISGAYNVYIGGGIYLNGTISGTAAIILNGTGTWSGNNSCYIYIPITFNTAGTITISSNVFFEGTMTYIAGTVTTTGSTLEIGGTSTFNTNGISWNNFTVTGGALTLTLSSDLTVAGIFDVTGGGTILTVSGAYNIFVAGNWTNNGTYTHGTETVVFDGTSTLNNTTTFYNLTFAPGATVTLESGKIFTIANTFTAAGTSANPITINASTSGSQATLSKSSGVVNGAYLKIKDSKATGGATFNALNNCINASDNSGWIFQSDMIHNAIINNAIL